MAITLKIDMNNAPIAELAAQIAALKVSGLGINNIVKQIREETGWPITKTWIDRRIETNEVYQKTIKALQDGIVKKAVSELKRDTAFLVPEIIATLKENLAKRDLKAIIPSLKILGIDVQEPEQKQQTAIQVILPGNRPKEKPVGEG